MAFLMLTALFLLPFFGNGPLYQFCFQNWVLGTKDAPICRQNWWTPLVFAASVYRPAVDKQCLSWLWIVSNDVIFFIGLVAIFYLYRCKPLYAFLTCFAILFASYASIMTEALLFKYTYRAAVPNDQLGVLKITPINACQGYVLGVIFALIWFSYKNHNEEEELGENKFKICFINKRLLKLRRNKTARILCITFGLIIMIFAIYIPYPIYQLSESNSSQVLAKRILSAVFLGIERTLLITGLMIFLLPSIIGKAGITSVIFGNRMFVPLARLQYSALLVNGVILMWHFFGRYQILRLDVKVINMSFVSLSLLSYLTAVVFTLLFESPFITMEGLLLCPTRKKKYELKGSFYEDIKDDIDDNKSDDSVELNITKPEQEARENSDRATRDSNNGSARHRLYSDNNDNSDNEFKDEREGEVGLKKSNSLTKAEDFDKNKKTPLLNGSEDSKNFTSFNEPLLVDDK